MMSKVITYCQACVHAMIAGKRIIDPFPRERHAELLKVWRCGAERGGAGAGAWHKGQGRLCASGATNQHFRHQREHP